MNDRINLTYKEICGTFDALKKTVEYLETKRSGIETFFKGKNKFIFTGSGSSYLLAKSMSMIYSMENGFPSSAFAAGDILLHAERYKKLFKDSAVVCISRSGRTSELLKAIDLLKSTGISFNISSIVFEENTPLESAGDFTLSMPWAFDSSVCQTRSVNNFYFAFAYITAMLSGNETLKKELKNIAEDFGFIERAESFLQTISFKNFTQCILLADAELEGLAEEAALAFKEISCINSNYYHLLDVRHGPIVLAGKETLVLSALGKENILEKNLLEDIKAKGAELISFSDLPLGYSDFSYGKKLSHIALGIPFLLLCQMIALKKSLLTGADPDKPKGLDPWIKL